MKKFGQTKPKTIVGIDYSLNSPAVCVSTNGGTSFSDCYFYYLTSKKKHMGKMLENVIGYEHKEYNGPIERFKNLSDWVLHILDTLHKKQQEKIIFIEGYSYGSKGQAIFQIAENGGILKYRLQKRYNVVQLFLVLLKSLPQVKVMLIKKRCTNNLQEHKVLI
jgi:hypothetical protein